MTDQPINRILCVDDEINILHMFNRTLGREFNLHTAISAENALALLLEHTDFAVIISDYNMPGMNGLELLKLARELSPNSVQILLTGNIDPNVSINAINETNIFRYLPKPCPMQILRKVVCDALEQYHLLLEKQRLTLALELKNQELTARNAELCQKTELLEYELEMAKAVYGNVVSHHQHSLPGLEYRLMTKGGVGGDFLLTHISPDKQSLYLMMGDVTGHGLQSALAVLLVAESFELFCCAEPEVELLAQSINEKICTKLPRGLFCAAFLLKLDRLRQHLHIWQGGMPNGFFLDSQGRILETLSANNLALGVLAEQDFAGTSRCHAITDADAFFLYSDGLTEQEDKDGNFFGEARLKQALLDVPADAKRVDYVIGAAARHQQQQAQSDDISLLDIHFTRICESMART